MEEWLEKKGATFEAGKGQHLKVFLNGRQSALPMHGTTDLGRGLQAAIKHQLGLKYAQHDVRLPSNITPDNGTVLLAFVGVPEAITFNVDAAAAFTQAVDALETALSFYVNARAFAKP